MDAPPHTPGRPLRQRMRTALIWAGAVVLSLFLLSGLTDNAVLWLPRAYLIPLLVVALLTALLRRRPLPALVVMLAGSLMLSAAFLHGNPWYTTELQYVQILAVDLAVGYITVVRSRRVSVVVAVVALAIQVLDIFLQLTPERRSGVEVPALAMITTWMIGNSIRSRRRYAETLRTQAAAQAVTAERLRIARELHDMVAHSIGVIAIQAGVGSRVIETQPAEARNALRTIEATSRETLAGLRRVVGGLRQTEAGQARESAPLDPAPGLADVDRLVRTTARAGVRVDVRWRGTQRPVPSDIDLSAYRIIQEALTNVARHAGTPECRVTVDYRDEELLIEIVDDGRGGTRGGTAAATGYGITGMRERVGLLHGELSAGPRAEGGFRVAARLPLPEPFATPVTAEPPAATPVTASASAASTVTASTATASTATASTATASTATASTATASTAAAAAGAR